VALEPGNNVVRVAILEVGWRDELVAAPVIEDCLARDEKLIIFIEDLGALSCNCPECSVDAVARLVDLLWEDASEACRG
jgi:hypothetical protein